ncbi:GNAT family N-acetyltransferase [Candidatus Bathyarchaeota archaeon]|nr:GNAT family N-acetyltransferase [Candidatus Bathyarchaeota archaeon]
MGARFPSRQSIMDVNITSTISREMQWQVARLIHEAFDGKIDRLLLRTTDGARAIRLIKIATRFDQGYYAIDGSTVVGCMGYSKPRNQFLHFSWRALRREFGCFGAMGRLMSQYFSRDKFQDDEMYITLIAVAEGYRSTGIGSRLIKILANHGKRVCKKRLVLDVVDSNPRARNLYERLGFTSIKQYNTSWFSKPAEFTTVVRMALPL